jgi:hypothetical protein
MTAVTSNKNILRAIFKNTYKYREVKLTSLLFEGSMSHEVVSTKPSDHWLSLFNNTNNVIIFN